MNAEGKRQDIIDLLNWTASVCEKHAHLQKRPSNESDCCHRKVRFLQVAKESRSEGESLDRPFRLGVVGMFKAGKSSVLNTFMNRKLLKEGRTETTSVLTELCYAPAPEDENGEVLWSDGSRQALSLDETLEYTDIRSTVFNSLSDDQRREKQDRISKIVLHVHSDFLENLLLLDTPGFGGSEIGNRKALDALENIDAALMIFSAGRVGSDDELETAHYLALRGREIVVLLNQVDNGRGEMRDAAEIEKCEAFIRENFTTIARDKKTDLPIIFRYSAKEVWNALAARGAPCWPGWGDDKEKEVWNALPNNQSNEETEDITSRLRLWGYLQTGDSEREQGVLQFIHDRYLSSNADIFAMKLRQIQTNIHNQLNGLLNEIDQQCQGLEESKYKLNSNLSERKQKIETEVEPRIPLIERKMEDLVYEHIQEFGRDMWNAIETVIDEFGRLDIRRLFKAMRNKDDLTKDAQEEFKKLFPDWRQENLKEALTRCIKRLLQNEWRSLLREIQSIDPRFESLSTQDLLDDISSKLQEVAVLMTTTITALVAFLLIPGGVVLDLLWGGLSILLNVRHSKNVSNKAAIVKRKAQIVVKNKVLEIASIINSEAIKTNELIAQKIRDEIYADGDKIGKQINILSQDIAQWYLAKKDIEHCIEPFKTSEFVSVT